MTKILVTVGPITSTSSSIKKLSEDYLKSKLLNLKKAMYNDSKL